jgi:hypothetical protein
MVEEGKEKETREEGTSRKRKGPETREKLRGKGG